MKSKIKKGFTFYRTPTPRGMVYRKVGETVALDGAEYVIEKVTESSATCRVSKPRKVSYTDTATGKLVEFTARPTRFAHINSLRERGAK